jgi:hypothetical protein
MKTKDEKDEKDAVEQKKPAAAGSGPDQGQTSDTMRHSGPGGAPEKNDPPAPDKAGKLSKPSRPTLGRAIFELSAAELDTAGGGQAIADWLGAKYLGTGVKGDTETARVELDFS